MTIAQEEYYIIIETNVLGSDCLGCNPDVITFYLGSLELLNLFMPQLPHL